MPSRHPTTSRRTVLKGIPALAALLSARPGHAATSSANQRFLFIFADGGWDPTWVFHPAFDDTYVDMPRDGSDLATSGGLQWVSGPGRPNVDTFFQQYGSQTAILNGMEVRSIAHERCRRLLLTGSSAAASTGIPGLLAAGTPEGAPLGHVVLSGPAYQSGAQSDILRVGTNGQLASLLDGSFVDASPGLRLPTDDLSRLEDAFLAEQVATVAPDLGAESRIVDAYARSLDRLVIADASSDMLVGGFGDTTTELNAALDLFESGLARCAIVADLGHRMERWDHHSDISRQAPSFDMLFVRLKTVCDMLSILPGHEAPRLLDEVTIVVFSEMGRAPKENASMGKDHWMTTSAMLIGGGIQGGQVCGAYKEAMAGAAVRTDTGAADEASGVVLQPGHLGATLMTLAGLDPVPAFGSAIAPLTGLLA